jgi:hypothetical protein
MTPDIVPRIDRDKAASVIFRLVALFFRAPLNLFNGARTNSYGELHRSGS